MSIPFLKFLRSFYPACGYLKMISRRFGPMHVPSLWLPEPAANAALSTAGGTAGNREYRPGPEMLSGAICLTTFIGGKSNFASNIYIPTRATAFFEEKVTWQSGSGKEQNRKCYNPHKFSKERAARILRFPRNNLTLWWDAEFSASASTGRRNSEHPITEEIQAVSHLLYRGATPAERAFP